MSQLFVLPKPLNINANLQLVAGARAYFYETGTTTPQNTYQDADLTTPHANPVVADAAGVLPPIYLDDEDPTKTQYRLTLRTSTDALIYTVDPVNPFVLTQALIGRKLYPQTEAEDLAGVTPTNYAYPEGDLRRYGGVGDASTDDSDAWQSALDVGRVFIPAGHSFKILTGATKTGRVEIRGEGATSKLLCDSTPTTSTFLLRLTSGDHSILSNFCVENITAPYTIQRWYETRVNTTAATTAGSANVVVASATGIAVGQQVFGPDSWNGTTVTAVAGTTITLADPASITNAASPIEFYAVNWNKGAAALATLAQSNAEGRYPPNVNDLDIWSSLTPTEQTGTMIGPVIQLAGDYMEVELITGRMLSIFIDGNYCQAHDCNFKGGWSWAGIAFMSDTVRKKGARAYNNIIRDHGFQGILFRGYDDSQAENNSFIGCGECGIKTYGNFSGGGTPTPLGTYYDGVIGFSSVGNHSFACYQGGFDYESSFGSPIQGKDTTFNSSVGDRATWCFNGVLITGRGWLINGLRLEYIAGGLGSPLAAYVHDSVISNCVFREINYDPQLGFNGIDLVGTQNKLINCRAFNETTRNTNYLVSVSSGTSGKENQLVNCDFRDAVNSQILLGGTYERFNCRVSIKADLSLSLDAPAYLLGIAQKTNVQTITAGVVTRVQFNTVPKDTYGAWDGTNYRFIGLPNGTYLTRSTIGFKASGNAVTDMRIYCGRNASQAAIDYAPITVRTILANDVNIVTVTNYVSITAATDFIAADVYCSGQNMNIGDSICILEIQRICD